MQGKQTNFEIDVFEPLVHAVRTACPKETAMVPTLQTSRYAIADHIRAATFAITDGAYPSNEGRGYVIRKLIRRSVWHAHLLGIHTRFLDGIVPLVVDLFKEAYPDLAEQRGHVAQIVAAEEDRFRITLDDGLRLLEDCINKVRQRGETALSGEDVFRLYDTYGFPDELTRIIAGKNNMTIDQNGFEQLMEHQRTKAREATVIANAIFTSSALDKHLAALPPTRFIGYDALETKATIQGLFVEGASVQAAQVGAHVIVVLDVTPFYAESGGQVGDRGTFESDGARIEITNTLRKDAVWYHEGTVTVGTVTVGQRGHARVDAQRRTAIMNNHTATHLLQAALRNVLGPHVRQLGSMVSDEKLRFDFSYQKALTDTEKNEIERAVNAMISGAAPVSVDEMPIEEAKKRGALAFFGDRYGSTVRVVSIGTVSKELCGGTHVSDTRSIGSFLITSESSIASGIRRIEAVTGDAVEQVKRETAEREADARRKSAEKQMLEAERKNRIASLQQPAVIQTICAARRMIGPYGFLCYSFDDLDQGALRSIFDALKGRIEKTVVVFVSRSAETTGILVALTKDLESSPVSAAELVKKINSCIDGKGGGKKMMAFSGARSVENLDALIAAIPSYLTQQISPHNV